MNDRSDRVESPWRRVRRWVGYLLGAALLIACIVVATRGADWSKLADADGELVFVMIFAVAFTVMTTSMLFWVVTLCFMPPGRRMHYWEMLGLIAASTLLNYLPLRPGLVGRAAYHKRMHGLNYRTTAVILLIVVLLSALLYAVLLAVMLWRPTEFLIHMAWAMAVLAIVLAAILRPRLAVRSGTLAPNANRLRLLAGDAGGIFFWLCFRMFEVIAMAGRLLAAFMIVGRPIDIYEALMLATCGMFITLVGLTPNGLGLREWFYGLIAASGFFGGDVEAGLQLGLAAGLIDRAAEVLVVAPTGTASIFYLFRRSRKAEGAKSEIRNPKSVP